MAPTTAVVTRDSDRWTAAGGRHRDGPTHDDEGGALLLPSGARARPVDLLPPQADALTLGRLVRRVEQWRLFRELREEARYIDIETTGLEPQDLITVVGVSDGHSTCVLVRDRGLTARALRSALADARLLVTFNGTGFDLPRLRAAFPGLPWDLPHFDLAIEGRAVGLSGGLKVVEHALGVVRPRDLQGVSGLEAARLWRAHQAGDPEAVRRLVRYCRADVEGLVALAPKIYARLRAGEEERALL